jgi:hypothetical protein
MGKWRTEQQSLLPTASPTDMDLAFFAGFYEGEGSSSITKSGGCVVQVPQKDPEMLFKARSFWGGSVRQISGRDCWAWILTGDRARLFLQAIYHMLSTRRKGQVDKVKPFELTGMKGAEISGMSSDRATLRSGMTEQERVRESNRVYAKANYARNREKKLAWMKENREHLNALQRERRKRLKLIQTGDLGNDVPVSFERNQLIN